MFTNKNNIIINLLAGLLLLLSAGFVSASTLSDLDGKAASINDYAGNGKWLVVMFWASDCHICNVKAHEYVDLQARHKDGNIHLLGITTDGIENKAAAESFIKEHKLNFPNLIGSLNDIGAMYYDMVGEQWRGTPTILIYNPKGKLNAAQAGAVPAEVIEGFIADNS